MANKLADVTALEEAMDAAVCVAAETGNWWWWWWRWWRRGKISTTLTELESFSVA